MDSVLKCGGKTTCRSILFCIAAVGLAAFTFPLAVLADEDYSGYIWMSSTDKYDSSSFDNNDNGRWKIGSASGEVAGAPSPGNKYYAYNTLCSPYVSVASGTTTNFVFAGDELVVRGGKQFYNCQSRSKADEYNVTVTVPHLVLLPDARIFVASARPSATAGECLVKGTDESPAYFWSQNANATVRCELDFKSESSDSVFRFQGVGKEEDDVVAYFRLRGDSSQYYGTFLVTNTLTQVFLDTDGGYECPGSFVMGNGSHMQVTTNATLGALAVTNGSSVALDDGCVLTVGRFSLDHASFDIVSREGDTSAPIVVTNSIAASGKVRLNVNFPEDMTSSLQKFPLVTLAADATGTLSADNFELNPTYTVASETGLSSAPEALYLRCVVEMDAETGVQTLYATHRRIVYLAGTDSADNAALNGNYSLWSDGAPINATNDYYAIGKELFGFSTDKDYIFAGASLTIRKMKFGSSAGMTFASGDYRFVGQSDRTIVTSDNVTFTNGTVTVVSNKYPVLLRPYSDKTVTFSSEIKGSGDIAMANYYPSNNPLATYDISGMNTNFTGGVRLYHETYEKATPRANPTNYCITVKVSDQRNLGGALGSFSADALSIENLSLLDVSGSATFDEPTRGWSVKGQGRIKVAEGETVTITNKQITYSGEFMKEGAGVLALGGTAKFTEEESETPLAGTNVLSVLAGSLMPADTTGCDGLAINFAAGTGLVLDAGATGDLKTYGLYNVKWDAPISVEGDAALPVSFRLPEDFNYGKCVTFGICTVSEAAANSIEVTDFAVTAPDGMSAKVEKGEVVDGKVTFSCTVYHAGFVIIFR